jgi:preprotein translocase subunit SecY
MDDVFDLLDPYLQQYHYDEVLQETARMVITMLVTLGISIAYTASGLLKIYPGNFTPFLVIIQLFLSSSVIHLLNQILDEYGICGIFSLSTAIHTSRTIFWQAFSPTLRHTEEGSMFEGSVLFFLNSLSSWESKKRAIEESFFRGYQPNLKTLGVSIFILIFIFYLKSLRVEIPVRLRNDPTIRGSYVIKLLYYEPKVLLFQVSLSSHESKLILSIISFRKS